MIEGKEKLYTALHVVCVCLWIGLMALIIWFSNQPDQVSSAQSNLIGKLVCELVINGYDAMSETMRNSWLELVDHIVRKTAHFSEYAALGVLTYHAFGWFHAIHTGKTDSARKQALTSELFCLLFAVSDEIHQYFIPGRWAMVSDVLLDSAGAMTGIVVLMLAVSRRKKQGNT